MRTPEQVQWDFVQEWLKKAGDDLRAARLLVEQEFEDYEATAFHAQQAAEKYVKAWLVRHQVEHPKTHNMKTLRDIVRTRDVELAENLVRAEFEETSPRGPIRNGAGRGKDHERERLSDQGHEGSGAAAWAYV